MAETQISRQLQSIYVAIKESNIRPAKQFVDLYKLITKRVKCSIQLERAFFSHSELFPLYVHHLFLKFGAKELSVNELDDLFSYVNKYKPNKAFVTNQQFETVVANMLTYLKDFKNTQHNILVLKATIHFYDYLLHDLSEKTSCFYIVKRSKSFAVAELTTAQMNFKTRHQNLGLKESNILQIKSKNSEVDLSIRANKLYIRGHKTCNEGQLEHEYEDYICDLIPYSVYDIEIHQEELLISINIASEGDTVASYQGALIDDDTKQRDFILFECFNCELMDLVVKIQENTVFDISKDFYTETDLNGCFELVENAPSIDKTTIMRNLQILYYFYSVTLDYSKSLVPSSKRPFFSLLFACLEKLLSKDIARTKQLVEFIEFTLVSDEEKSMDNSHFRCQEIAHMGKMISSLDAMKSTASGVNTVKKISNYLHRLSVGFLSRIYLFVPKPSEYGLLTGLTTKAFSLISESDKVAFHAIIRNVIIKIHFYSYYHQDHSEFIDKVLFTASGRPPSTFCLLNLARIMEKIDCCECLSVIENFMVSLLENDKSQGEEDFVRRVVNLLQFIFASNCNKYARLLERLFTNLRAALPYSVMVWMIQNTADLNRSLLVAGEKPCEPKEKRQGKETGKDMKKLNMQARKFDINPDEINKMFDFGGEKGTHKDAEVKLQQEIIDLIDEIVEDMERAEVKEVKPNIGVKPKKLSVFKPNNQKANKAKKLLIEMNESECESSSEEERTLKIRNEDPILFRILGCDPEMTDTRIVSLPLGAVMEYMEGLDISTCLDVFILNYASDNNTADLLGFIPRINESCVRYEAEIDWLKLLLVNCKLYKERDYKEGYLYLVDHLIANNQADKLLTAVFQGARILKNKTDSSLLFLVNNLIGRYLCHLSKSVSSKFGFFAITVLYLAVTKTLDEDHFQDNLSAGAITKIIKTFKAIEMSAIDKETYRFLIFGVLYIVIKFGIKEAADTQNLAYVLNIITKHNRKFIDANLSDIMLILYMTCKSAKNAEDYFNTIKAYCFSTDSFASLMESYKVKNYIDKPIQILKTAFSSFDNDSFKDLASSCESQLLLFAAGNLERDNRRSLSKSVVEFLEHADKCSAEFISFEQYIDVR